MAGILYKELILNKKNLLLLAVSLLAFSIIPFAGMSSNESASLPEEMLSLLMVMVYAVLFFMTGMFQPNIFSVDETKKWAYYISSSPAGVGGQIEGKYIFGALISLGTLIWCFLLGTVASFVYGIDNLSMLAGIWLFYFQISSKAVEYPFMVRFGSKAGAVYKSGVFFLVIFLLILYALFGDLKVFGSSLDELWASLLEIINGEAFSGAVLFVLSLCPVAAVTLYCISMSLSKRFYLKGAEGFDK